MANLTETAVFDSAVYRIDQDDSVLGWDGSNINIANQQAQALANRTQWLKSRVDLGSRITGFDSFTPPSSGATLSLTPDSMKGKHVRVNVANFDAVVILPPLATVGDGANVSISVEPGANFSFYSSGNRFVELNPNPGEKIYDAATNQELDEVFLFPYTVAKIHKLDSTRYLLWREQTVEQAPPGMIVAWSANTVPYGWLECNGASLSRSVYAALYANIGLTFGNPGASLFKIPDLRGEFVRGWDNGRGADTGRAFGTAQAESVNTAGVQLREASTTWAANGAGVGSSVAYFENSNIAAYGSNMTLMGGTETRPRNIAMMYIIKF